MSGNGKNGSAGSCPHGCARCKAIELGYGNRGMNTAQFIEIHGGIAERPPADRPEWGQDTLEAQLAAEVAQIARAEAERLWFSVSLKVDEERENLGRLSDVARFERMAAIEAAEHSAHAEMEAAFARHVDAARRYKALAARDRETHRQLRLREAELEREETRRATAASKSSGRRMFLTRFKEPAA